jgi:hypothetical protein
MHASDVTPEVVAKANELYWSSNRSVNQIADDLDLSKGALYGIIEPLRTGRGCPMCGDEVVVPNRTARERDLLDCPTCEWDGNRDEAIESDLGRTAAADGSTDLSGVDVDERGRDVPAAPPPLPLSSDRARTIAGGALLGAAAGLALVLWARRR